MPSEGGEVKILCAVREPIGRNISHFFQDIERFIPRNPMPSQIQDIVDIFIEKFEHDYPDQWFDQEFRSVTGVDIYQKGFDKERGFSVYKNGRISALVYKIEVAETNDFSNAFREFCCLEYPISARHNVGKNKKYGKLYDLFKRCGTFDPEFCEAQHKSRYARCFYSEKELAMARQKLIKVSLNNSP